MGGVEAQPADPGRAADRGAGGGGVRLPDAPHLHPPCDRKAWLRQLDPDRHGRDLDRRLRSRDPHLQPGVQGRPAHHLGQLHGERGPDHQTGIARDRHVARPVRPRLPVPHLHPTGDGDPCRVAAARGGKPDVDSGRAHLRHGHRHQRRAGRTGGRAALSFLLLESQLGVQPDDPGTHRHHLRGPRQRARSVGGGFCARHLRIFRGGLLRRRLGAARRLPVDHPDADPAAERPVRNRRGEAAVSARDAAAVGPTRPALDRGAAPWRQVSLWTVGGLLAAGIVLPLLLVRINIGTYLITLLILFFVQAVVAQSWNLIMGYGGIYSFAQVALFAVGGWTSGVLVHSLGWNPFLAILVSPLVAVVAALGIGLPTLRLRGVYVVLLTLAFHELARVFAVTGPRFISGGGYGLVTVQTFQFGNAIGDQRTVYLYYLAGLIFAIATFAIWRVIHSPLGVAMTVLRDSETYAVSRGINQFRVRIVLFAISAFFTGLAGGYSTHYNGGISTTIFDFPRIIDLLAMIVIGGWGTFGGPILGAGIVIGLDQYLVALGDYQTLILGLALAGIAVFAPQGLWPVIRRLYENYLAPEPLLPAVEVSPAAPHDTTEEL
ncbi:MAG: branched-chain amino acid ABC transporter permease [Chloroflexi bacterium]|nr:MAG: branched-chain amino acid ABC transporter permease [Chloroflexota bacterium]